MVVHFFGQAKRAEALCGAAFRELGEESAHHHQVKSVRPLSGVAFLRVRPAGRTHLQDMPPRLTGCG